MHASFDRFDPLVARWFARRYGEPTAVQAAAWPAIARGEHVLVTAPTGTGKTLTAFLFALDRLLTGAWPGGSLRVLYVSPLKALNTDIRRNLLAPLAELTELFVDNGLTPPTVRVETRSGDTDQNARRRMLRHPPEILITTPESLNLLLGSTAGQGLFGTLETVILDEIHAIADNKRGTHLITAVDRLVPLAGEFQRVALSATVRPLDTVAAFVGGYTFDGHEFAPRRVQIVRADDAKEYATSIHFPGAGHLADPGDYWPRVARELQRGIERNRSTLVFVNSRRQAERMALLLNADQPQPLAYAHHGSLSREAREVVEERLKRGELRAIVATGSLELGIDVGALDEVLLLETPRSVAQTLQRLGRAGHSVGEVSRGRFYAVSGRDLLEAVVMTGCVARRELEPLRPVRGALDVLAQIIVAITGVEPYHVDDLYDFVRTSWPYRELSRRAFDLVLDMLAGRYAQTRLPALLPRITLNGLDQQVSARDDGVRAARMSGGTIPDRGYFAMRHADTRARIAELDEEFVWERRTGDVFVMGTQTWRIESISHSDVLVRPAQAAGMAPFWRADEQDRERHFSDHLLDFLETLDARLADPTLVDWLQQTAGLDLLSARALVGYLHTQRVATGTRLPHRHHLLLERVSLDGGGCPQLVLHTLWGGTLNRPYSLALAAAWRERFGEVPQVHAGNDCIILLPTTDPGDFDLAELVPPARLEELLREQLEASGFFGARFRENAARALLLTRGPGEKRLPLWLNRERSKRLLEAVARFDDFPILAETWRTCLVDCFELAALRERLGELRDGVLTWSCAETLAPSPFAGSTNWRHVNHLMYEDDAAPGSHRRSNLAEDLLREVVFTSQLRPELDPALCAQFAAKLQRVWPGYAPGSADDALELLKERLLVPDAEWAELLAAMQRDHGLEGGAVRQALADRAVRVPGCGSVLALENLPRLAVALDRELETVNLVRGRPAPTLSESAWARLAPPDDVDPLAELLAGWLQFHGPVPPDSFGELLGLAPALLDDALDGLAQAQRVVVDKLTHGGPPVECCDADNLERLLRLSRRAQAPDFAALPLEALPLFLAQWQGLTRPATRAEELQEPLGRLLGWPASPAVWEAELLPARSVEYQTAWLDRLWQLGELVWYGCGPQQTTLVFGDLLDLVRTPPAADAPEPPLPRVGRYPFEDLAEGQDTSVLTAGLWAAAWRGQVTNDTWAALRLGAATGFAASDLSDRETRHGVRAGVRRWRASRPFTGNWYRLPAPEGDDDPLERTERDRERVRLLLERYGLLCRELLTHELPALRWGSLFRALRLMELAGEVLAGQFFSGLPGLQFSSPAALAALRRALDDDAVFWLNAADPASLCGAGLADLDLPERRATTHLVYHGRRLVLVSKRRGGELDFRVPPDAPRLAEYLGVLDALQQRAVDGVKGVRVTTINGAPASDSPYLPALAARFEAVPRLDGVTLWRH